MRLFSVLVALLSLALFANAEMAGKMGGEKKMGKMQMFQSVPMEEAELLQSGKDKLYCPNCGMNLPKFYKTNHLAKLKDGSIRQYCSIYCLVEEMEFSFLRDKKEKIEHLMVVDVPSKKFIDVKDAYYVIGSSKPGTMTHTSKYAFKDKKAAEAFASENGGEVGRYEDAYKIALEDFAKDTEFVLSKRESKMYMMGEKLYGKCDAKKMEQMDAHTMGEMKAMVRDSGVCGKELNDGQLQAITLYYWDKKLRKSEALHKAILKK